MKQKFKWLLALVAMVASINLWAGTYTYDFRKNASNTAGDNVTDWYSNSTCTTHLKSGNTNTLSGAIYYKNGAKFNVSATTAAYFMNSKESSALLIGKKGSLFTLPTYSGEKITSVKITCSSGSGTSVTCNIYSGDNKATSEDDKKGGKNFELTFPINANYQSSELSIKVTNANNFQIAQIDVTTESSASECTNKVTVTKNSATNGSYTLKAGSASGSEISDGGTIDNCDANATIVVVPNANTHYHCTEVTATNSASVTGPDGDGNYTITYTKGSSINSSISASFAEDAKVNVSWKVNGGNATGGSSVAYIGSHVEDLPTPPGSELCDGSKVFVGWTNALVTDGKEPKVLFTDAAGAPEITSEDAVTYYAVFANQTGEGVSKVLLNEDWSGYSINTNSSIALPTQSGEVGYNKTKVNYAASSTNTKLYQQTSIYGGGTNELMLAKASSASTPSTFTISNIPSAELTTATISFRTNGNADLTLISETENVTLSDFAFSDNQNPSSGSKCFIGTAKITIGSDIETFAIKFSYTNTSSNLRIDNIIIKYETTATYSSYATSCASPKITVAAGENGSVTLYDENLDEVTNGYANFPQGSIITIEATPSSDAYEFEKWTISGEGADATWNEGSSANSDLAEVVVGSKDATFTATFRAATTKHIIVVGSNNATMGSAAFDDDSDEAELAQGDQRGIKATNNDPTLYIFDKWTIEEGDATIDDVNNPIATLTCGSEGAMVVANFKDLPKYMVKFYANDDDAEPISTEDVISGHKISSFPEVTSCDPTQVSLVGWTNDKVTKQADAPTTLYKTTEDVPVITEETILYAVWATVKSDAGTVTWNINGVKTSAAGGTDVNTALTTSSIDPATETGVWTAVASNSYAATQSSKAQLGSNSYKFNGTITLSGTKIPSGATIEQIDLTATSSATDANPYSVTTTVGGTAFGTAQSLSSGSANCQWKPATGVVGNTIVISTTCGYNKNITISAIAVKYSYNSAKDFTTKCETPTIVVNPQFVTPEGKYCGEVDVELSQAAGVDIYYTKDNTTPTKSSDKYTSPIEVNATTTIKAIAIDANNNSSDVVEATYSIPTKSYASMAEVLAEMSTTDVEGCINFDDWVVTGTTNGTVYLANKDNSLGVIISGYGHGFAAGNKLTGNVVGKVKKNSNGSVQISDVVAADFAEIGTGSVTPADVTIDALTVSDQGRLVTIKEVTANKSSNTDVTLTDANSNTITYYNTFTTNPSLTKDAKYNVTGVVFYYNSTKEIAARSTDDVEWIFTQLTAPTLNAATEIGTTKATISWTPAADAANVSSYSITYNDFQVTNISKDATSYTFSGLASGTSYACSIVAVGDAVTYKTSEASNEVEFETLGSDTKWDIIYHVANGTTPTSPTQVTDGTTFVYPSVADVDCAEYQFIGWTTDANYAGGSQKPADIKEAGETSGNISGPVNLYAVYGMTSSKKTTFDDFVADADMTSAQFVIAAKVGESYYALPNNLGTNAGTKEAKTITLNQYGEVITNLDATKVTFIKSGDNFKVNLSSTNYLYWTSNTSIGQHALPNPVTNAYLWSVTSASTAGSYHMVNVGAGSRALIYRAETTNKFGAYGGTNVDGTEYYDVELIPVVISENDYTREPDCKSIPTLVLGSSLGNVFNLVEADGNKATTTITVAEGSQSDGELTLSVSDLYTGVTVDNTAKTVTFSAAGTYVVKAAQAATQTWAEAEASITLTVKKSIITITYNGNAEGVTNVPEPQQVLQDETFEIKSGAEMLNGQNAFVKWNTASDKSGDDYQAGANASFTASTTLYAVWQPAKKITVPEFEGGSISVTPQFALPYTNIAVTVNPDPGYIVKKLTYVGDESGEEHKIYSNSFSMPEEDVTISALFIKGAMYEIATSDGAVTSTGNLPTGSEGVFVTTYTAGSDKTQITDGNTWTFTIKGYEGKVIRSIILNLQSNKTSGKGSLTITQGTRTLVNQENANFNEWFGGQDWSTKHFREVTMPMDWTYVTTDDEIVITIVGSGNSLYCNSIFVDWEDGYGRDMSNGYMGTHCYPFDIAAGDYKGAQFYEIAYRIGDTRIYFDQVDHVEAGVPYLVVPNDEENGSMLVAIVTPHEVPATDKNGFVGSYVEAPLDANSGLYIVYNNEFRLAGEYVAVGANRAYIKLEEVATNDPNPKAPHRISLRNSETGAATGISNIREEFGNSDKAIKVFHDGNIYFIRESKIYNAQGVELK